MEFLLPQHTIFYQLEKAIKLYRKMAQERISKSGYDITVNQLILLINLVEKPNSTQVELSESILKDYASVARMVDILVKKNYLTRVENSSDRRKKDLTPTKKTSKMITDLVPIINDYRKVARENFTHKKLETFSNLLNQLINNCEKNIER